jgi:hypothetical protein
MVRRAIETCSTDTLGTNYKLVLSVFFCFRFVFSFRPVAAGGAGRGSKGQAPPFGESYAYGQPR